MKKPILSYEEQIDHFVKKDITFNNMSKEIALEYLKNNNNFFNSNFAVVKLPINY